MDYHIFKREIIHSDYGTNNQPGTSYGWKDWEKKKNITREMKFCADLMIEIFGETNHEELLPYREWYEVYFLTFSIGKCICEMVCILCVHLTLRFSSKHIDLCASIAEIPRVLSEVLQSLKRTSAKVLSNNISDFMAETIERRNGFLKTCIDFNIFVCQGTKKVLKVMKSSKDRSEVGFKPLLVSVVMQFHYIEKGCGLARLIIEREQSRNRDMENQSIHLTKEFKKMFKHTKRVLINGRYALRSLSYREHHAVDVNVLCDKIKELENVLQSGTGDLNNILEEIEVTSSKICKLIDKGEKCLPKGYQQIEDVTVMNSSDFDRHLEDNEFVENGSDFDGFLNDDNNDENLTRLPVKEIENVLVSSGVDKSEILHVFKMEGFKSPVKICVDNHSEFIKSKVGGKVFRQGLWVSARDVVIEGNQVFMIIEPGELFIVYYEFPKRKKKMSKEEMKRGLTIPIPEAHCSVTVPPSDVGRDVTIMCKIHMTDETRIKEYKEEHPNEYGDVAVLDGVQMKSNAEINKGFVEFQRGSQQHQNTKYFCFKTSGFGLNDWECNKVEPEFQNKNMMFQLSGDDKVSYIVAIDNVESKKNKSSGILDLFLTLLGFKAQCKLLTLYKVPEEQDNTINLCVLCIESKGSDLSDQASRYFMNNWIQIEEHDESSDFLITPGDVIRLGFSGNVGPKEGNPPVITFIKKGSCFSRVELHCLDNKYPKGCVQMNLNDNTLDSKQLDWQYLLGKWKHGDYFRSDVQDGGNKSSSQCNLL
ncbi:uncharacterized protein [Magallana gigas]|uniref:uncharacterized protein isoform X1 n=1 Tax=Magallana gigas TaxID=29159 RepID=UPI0033405906